MKVLVLLAVLLFTSPTFAAEGDIYCFWDEKNKVGHDCVVERYDGIAYGPGIKLEGSEANRNKQGAFLSEITEPPYDSDLEKYGDVIWKREGNRLFAHLPVVKKTPYEVNMDRRVVLEQTTYKLMKWFVAESILHLDNAPPDIKKAYDAWKATE